MVKMFSRLQVFITLCARASPNLLNSLTQKSQGQIVKPRAREHGKAQVLELLEETSKGLEEVAARTGHSKHKTTRDPRAKRWSIGSTRNMMTKTKKKLVT